MVSDNGTTGEMQLDVLFDKSYEMHLLNNWKPCHSLFLTDTLNPAIWKSGVYSLELNASASLSELFYWSCQCIKDKIPKMYFLLI